MTLEKETHMNIRHRFLTFFIFSSFILSMFCTVHTTQANDNLPSIVQPSTPAKIYGKVTEVIEAPGYTYAEVDTGQEKIWAAGPKTSLKIGDMVSFSTKMPMQNFHSSSMNRDFKIIYFVNSFSTTNDVQKTATAGATAPGSHRQSPHTTAPIEGIAKLEPGNTILDIHADKDNLKGKTVRLRGKITKFNPNIMGKNWAHVRDSSTLDDLTITTRSMISVGDVVIIEGTLEVNKDFGYGYVYPVIVENTKITKE
jgi:hypothetical protein